MLRRRAKTAPAALEEGLGRPEGLIMKTARLAGLVTVTLVFLLGPPAAVQLRTFAPGDVFVSLETGQVQW